jgi:beta-phosphoglucomutase
MHKDAKLPFRPKAVIFDMDGVITDTMGFHFEAWKKTLSDYGIKASYCDIYLREGQKGVETAMEMMQEQGMDASLEKSNKILSDKEAMFKEISEPRLMKGAESLITDLKDAGYILALVTGTARGEVKKILPHKLLKAFDYTVTGDEVSTGKPHPEPYQKALKTLNLKPSEAVVIENAPFGIRSAKKAGIYCIAVCTYLDKKHLQEADLILDDLAEADRILLQMHRNR